jgi:mannose/fructose/N-acetylgalactosamine-specific phosphotransferase system component IIC
MESVLKWLGYSSLRACMLSFWLGLAAMATVQLTVAAAVAGCSFAFLHFYMNTRSPALETAGSSSNS